MDARRALLHRMIKRYALDNRLQFGVAWARFEDEFRGRCGVNIDAHLARLRREKRIPAKKRYTIPAAIELIGQLDRAVQVADHMLGGKH